ncbi:hypothetical protein [Haloarcula sp. 1CSR25-25]|uniref:hypothetical protein n=1 Tax=Haloarcula sp. 1CSR25-25 TaxID=2862545 RepID=UPI002895414B|nr:hypothetical protein [Haloarcula sp. 1CSR25-25]MDT3434710.1 hypothetical protein [Haloarcula sp. 1CSR25-25]
MSEADDEAFQAWTGKLSQSSAKLAADVSAEILATEFGVLDSDALDDLCSDAIMVAFDEGCHEVSLSHFRDAYETLTTDEAGETPDTSDSSASDATESGVVQEAADSPDPSSGDVNDTPESTATTVPADSDASTPNPAAMDRDALEAEVEALRERVDEIESLARDTQGLVQAVRRQMAEQAKLLVGEELVQEAGIAADSVVNHHQRLRELDARVQEQGDKIQMVRVDGGGSPDDPDARARRIRQTLYNKAKDHPEGKAQMDRSDVDSRLGGGHHRDTVLDAMKRAADGYDAESDGRPYTAINGSSDLQPVDAITFSVGDGRGSPSKVVMNLADVTGAEIRQNLTTKETAEGPE